MHTDGMSREKICGIILEKIEKISDHRTELLEEKRKGEFLTGPYWNLTAEQMVYLYYEICSQFQIQIETRALEQYRFATVNGIADIVAARLKEQR